MKLKKWKSGRWKTFTFVPSIHWVCEKCWKTELHRQRSILTLSKPNVGCTESLATNLFIYPFTGKKKKRKEILTKKTCAQGLLV